MKKSLCLLLCLCIFTMTVACANQHEHTFAESWNYDEENHWHVATCEHMDEKSDVGAHADDDGNDICDVCGYIADHSHTYETTWTQGEETHWYASTCGHNVKKEEAAHVDENKDGACDICEYTAGHEHMYAEEWSSDENGHYHAPICNHAVAGADQAAHVDDDNDGGCDVCGYTGGHEHTYAETWTTSEEEHWNEVTCGHTVDVGNKGSHVDSDNDKKCDVCGVVAEHFHTFETKWTTDATHHYHQATCGHDFKDSYSEHDGYSDDGICDTCKYVLYNMYTITVNAPSNVTIKNLPAKIKDGSDVTFTVIVPNTHEIATCTGATLVGNPAPTTGANIYTYKISKISKNVTVKITTNMLVAAEEVAEGKSTLSATQLGYCYKDITFTAPSAGKYVIYSTNQEQVQFGPNSSSATYVQIYKFDVTKAGSVTVKARYFAWGAETVNFDYVVCKIEDTLTLKTMTGSGYKMPTNVVLTVTYTAPSAGFYQISSSTKGVAWNDEISTIYVFQATKANQVITFTLKLDDLTDSTFDFDWNIEKLTPTTVSTGNKSLTVPYGKYVAYSFKPSKASSYSISVGSEYSAVYTWNEEYQVMTNHGKEYILEDATTNTAVVFYLMARDYEGEMTKDVSDTLKIADLGNLIDQRGNAIASASGALNTIVNNYSDTFDYKIEAPSNVKISFDNGKTWVSSKTVSIDAYATYSFLVKSTNGATSAILTITRISYEFTLSMGTQTQTMVPGKEYLVHLSGFTSDEYYHSFILSWTNKDVVVYFGAATVTSGTPMFNYSSMSSALTIVYNGSAEANIQFTLKDNDSGSSSGTATTATLALGNNDIKVSISNSYASSVEATFTASSAGTYILSAASGEKNAVVIIEDDFGSEEVTLPYQFTLSKNESITFIVSTSLLTGSEDTINLVLTKK